MSSGVLLLVQVVVLVVLLWPTASTGQGCTHGGRLAQAPIGQHAHTIRRGDVSWRVQSSRPERLCCVRSLPAAATRQHGTALHRTARLPPTRCCSGCEGAPLATCISFALTAAVESAVGASGVAWPSPTPLPSIRKPAANYLSRTAITTPLQHQPTASSLWYG